MVATNETDDDNENGKSKIGNDVFFLENEKIHKYPDPLEGESTQDDQDSDEEDLEYIDGKPSPAEIKLKMKKALLEFRCKVEDAIRGNYLLGEPDKKLSPGEIALAKEELRDIILWGIPLLPSKAHEGTDIILTKFLRAKGYKVQDAFEILQKTMMWRKENHIDGILDEELDCEFGKAAGYLKSRDRQGRPVCYNVWGPFRDKKLYKKTLGTEEKREKFLRWRIQLMEKGIKKLDFRGGGVDSIIQIIDLKNSPGQGIKELQTVSKKALLLFQNYYPELIHRNIVVNAPFWFYTSQVLFSRFMNQRTKKKFVFARPPKATKTLLKFIDPERLPVEYGGLKRENDEEFSPVDKASELLIKGGAAAAIEFPVSEPGVTMIWDVTVLGWEVAYKEEFVPDDEGSYTILLQNQKRVGESIRNSFYINEPGRIVITIENGCYKTKRMFYRSKARPTLPMLIFLKKQMSSI